MYSLARNLLFTLPPETSHELSLDLLNAAEHLRAIPSLMPDPVFDPVQAMGITFPNRVGLAAGLDKNGDYFNALGALGFGFVEIGTVTPRPQPGNPQPRLFRLPEAEAIINRMGFNNKGVDHLVKQAKRRRFAGVLGINIGKNFDTPVEAAKEDYLICLEKVYDYADYITINISSPNTPGLRDLQFGKQLDELLKSVSEKRQQLADENERRVPLAVKIAPDMDEMNLKAVADILVERGIDGVIATNTTVDKSSVAGLAHGEEQGGLSGGPLTHASTDIIFALNEALQGALPIIGVGGILTPRDARAKIEAGATLVQIYTGFIYRGPSLIRKCAEELADN
tara:strand:- start:491 stop:1507 length:1017 start_codon:yes stop_codon:yes gene_type:complete